MLTFLVVVGAMIACYMIGSFDGHRRGWVEAHLTVADECRKLGKFYVGKSVFTCTEIKEPEECKKT